MGAATYRDRSRAESFGADADRYDRTRPGYPTALVGRLLDRAGRRVLDVGCGTGKLGRLFAERGAEVLGVEPDPRMAAVARRHGLRVEVTRFEDWDPAGRLVDVVVAGQAWHWVEPEPGAAKAASVLVPGGRLALCWNRARHDPDVQAALDDVYAELAPELSRGSMVLGTLPPQASVGPAVLVRTGRFAPPEEWRFDWEQRYPAAGWVDQLPTHSDHRKLPPDRLTRLLAAVRRLLEERFDGVLTVYYSTHALVSERLPDPAG